LRRLQIPLRVARQLPPRRIERRLVADAGEHVEERAVRDCGETDVVGGDRLYAECARERFERHVGGLFVAQQVTLQLDEHAAAAEQADDAIEQAADAVTRGVEDGTAGERNEAGGTALELV